MYVELQVIRRPKRRTHLLTPGATLPACGTITALTGAQCVPIPLIGGATAYLRNELVRELDHNTCKRCTRIAGAMMLLYIAKDQGRA